MGGEMWSGDGGEDGEGGSEWRGAREESGLALKPGISEGVQREEKVIRTGAGFMLPVCHVCYNLLPPLFSRMSNRSSIC